MLLYRSFNSVLSSITNDLFIKGPDYCTTFYKNLSNALYEGGVDGFLLESLNCWEEAHFALEGVKAMKMVKYSEYN